MHHDSIQFHNVAELRAIDDRDGLLLQRVPETVRTDLEAAQSRVRHPAGAELRFVPDGPVELTLSTVPGGDSEEITVRVFWGPIQSQEEYVVGTTPRTIELSMPDSIARLRSDAIEDLAFDPRVCRVRLPGEHRGGYTCYHGIDGEVRPPTDEEVPGRRLLAYGTSITEGEAPLAEHLTYVDQTARRIGADPINLGVCGTAYCEPVIADHIAERTDWDVATLSISVNMVGEFSPETFRERAEYMVETIAGANPEKPIVAITLFRNGRDVFVDHEQGTLGEQFREELRGVVERSAHDNVHLLEGTELLPTVDGLTTDFTHPGDNAMITMGENLACALEELLD